MSIMPELIASRVNTQRNRCEDRLLRYFAAASFTRWMNA